MTQPDIRPGWAHTLGHAPAEGNPQAEARDCVIAQPLWSCYPERMKIERLPSRLILTASLIAWVAGPLAAQQSSPAQQAEAAYRKGLAAEQAGDPEAAKSAYEDALRIHSRHANARYRLGQVKLHYQKIGAKGRERSFHSVMIAEFRVDNASLQDALTALSKLTSEASQQQVAPNFLIQDPDGKLEGKTVTLVMKGTPAGGILKYMMEMSGAKARFDEHAIVIHPR